MWILTLAVPVAAVPIVGRDGERVERDDAITFGLVGGLATATPDALVDLQQAELAFLVTVGDAVHRGTRRRYRQLEVALGDLPVVPVPGAGEARGDQDLSRFFRAWEGLGVRGSERPATWRAFDLVSAGTPWRVLVLDADDERLGERFLDELIWVPKVVAPLTTPLLVVSNRPVDTLVEGAPPTQGARRLHEQVRRHSDPTRVPLVAAAGGAAEFLLPGGPWGEAWLSVGRISGPAETLRRVDATLIVHDGFDEALTEHFDETTGDVGPILALGDYDAERYPVEGWWRVTAGPTTLELALRMREPTGWTDVFTITWSRETGWERGGR